MTINEAIEGMAASRTIEKKPITAPRALNEAFHYARPSSFSRGLRLDFGAVSVLLISGTASIGPNGETLHVGDFRAQTRRTFENITALPVLLGHKRRGGSPSSGRRILRKYDSTA